MYIDLKVELTYNISIQPVGLLIPFNIHAPSPIDEVFLLDPFRKLFLELLPSQINIYS